MSGALVVRGLEVVRGERAVLRGVDLDVAPGEICALMGVSGAGRIRFTPLSFCYVAATLHFRAGRVSVSCVLILWRVVQDG